MISFGGGTGTPFMIFVPEFRDHCSGTLLKLLLLEVLHTYAVQKLTIFKWENARANKV